MRPVKYSSNSANIAFYADGTSQFPAHLVEVLRNDTIFYTDADGTRTAKRRPVPIFQIVVRRWKSERGGNKEVARFTYEPKTKPKTYNLPERTVNRLLKEKGL